MIFIAKAIPIIIGILIFGLLVLVHELGHFWAARKNGVFVEEFAIGMGPVLFSIQGKETRYSIRLFPMGGFCKMLGEDGGGEDAAKDPRAFNNRPVWRRMVIILAGAAMNLLLAFIVFFAGAWLMGYGTTTIYSTTPGTPAETAGILPGDRVTHVNGKPVPTGDDLTFSIGLIGGNPAAITLSRDGETLEKTMTPAWSAETGRYLIGVTLAGNNGLLWQRYETPEATGIIGSVVEGFWQLIFWIKLTFFSLGQLFAQNYSIADLSGPIGVVSMINTTYEASMKVSVFLTLDNLMKFTGMLCANIGVFNLLPLPALDGGRFIFLAVEGVRRKPVPPEKEGMVHFVGFVLLIALGIFVAYQDVLKFIL